MTTATQHRFTERRPAYDPKRDELPMVVVKDTLTGEWEEFVDDFSGGKLAWKWRVEREGKTT